MKKLSNLIIISSFAMGFAAGDPCVFPQKIESRDIVFIGRLFKEELVEIELLIKIENRQIKSAPFTKLSFAVDTVLNGQAIDTIQIMQLLNAEEAENFQVGMQYCMHTKYIEETQFLFDRINLNSYQTSRCLMRIAVSYTKGVSLDKKLMENISKYCIAQKTKAPNHAVNR